MNGQISASTAGNSYNSAKLRELEQEVNCLCAAVDCNEDCISSVQSQLNTYKVGRKTLTYACTVQADILDANDATIETLSITGGTGTCPGLIVSSGLATFQNGVQADEITAECVCATTQVNTPKVYASNCIETPLTKVQEGNTCWARQCCTETQTLHVSCETNMCGQVNIDGDMTFTKNNGVSHLQGNYLQIEAEHVELPKTEGEVLHAEGCATFERDVTIGGDLKIHNICPPDDGYLCLSYPELYAPKITGLVTEVVESTTALGLDESGNVIPIKVIPSSTNAELECLTVTCKMTGNHIDAKNLYVACILTAECIDAECIEARNLDVVYCLNTCCLNTCCSCTKNARIICRIDFGFSADSCCASICVNRIEQTECSGACGYRTVLSPYYGHCSVQCRMKTNDAGCFTGLCCCCWGVFNYGCAFLECRNQDTGCWESVNLSHYNVSFNGSGNGFSVFNRSTLSITGISNCASANLTAMAGLSISCKNPANNCCICTSVKAGGITTPGAYIAGTLDVDTIHAFNDAAFTQNATFGANVCAGSFCTCGSLCILTCCNKCPDAFLGVGQVPSRYSGGEFMYNHLNKGVILATSFEETAGIIISNDGIDMWAPPDNNLVRFWSEDDVTPVAAVGNNGVYLGTAESSCMTQIAQFFTWAGLQNKISRLKADLTYCMDIFSPNLCDPNPSSSFKPGFYGVNYSAYVQESGCCVGIPDPSNKWFVETKIVVEEEGDYIGLQLAYMWPGMNCRNYKRVLSNTGWGPWHSGL